MHSSAFISTVIPVVVLAALPQNITYPRRVLHRGSVTLPTDSSVAKPTASLDAYPGVFTGPASICMQPVITVTATVTSTTSCGGKPPYTSVVFDDCRYDRPKLSTCTFPKRPFDFASNSAKPSDTSTIPAKLSKTATVQVKASKNATVTWWDSTHTITGVAPWPVVPTTSRVMNTINNSSYRAKYATATVWAETYSVSTATVKLNTTSISGIFVNPAILTRTHHAEKTRTSTLVDFHTMTKAHAHTAVPDPSEMADDSSDDDESPIETRLSEHPSVPAPISIVDDSRISHIASKPKSTTQHPAATEYPQNGTFDKACPVVTSKDLG